MDKKKKNIIALIVAASVIIAAAVYLVFMLDSFGTISLKWMFRPKYDLQYYHSEHGTADKPEGNTVVVSVMLSNPHGSWEGETERADEQLENLAIASQFIEEQAARYNKEINMIYDWKENPDLIYYHEVDTYIFSLGSFNPERNEIWYFVNKDIPHKQLVEKYNADNILYLICTNLQTQTDCWAFANDCTHATEYQYDSAYIANGYIDVNTEKFVPVPAAVYAHEMLHLFGAQDIYNALGSPINLSWELVSKFEEENYYEIMRLQYEDWETSLDENGKIRYNVSDFTAYYLGWIDERPAVVDENNLLYSQHDPDFAARYAEWYPENS